MAEKGMAQGIQPTFDGRVDLEVSDPRAKALILTYLFHDEGIYPYRLGLSYFPGAMWDGATPAMQILSGRTFLDHWNEHREQLSQRMSVKFVDVGKDISERAQRKRMDQIIRGLEESGIDLATALVVPLRSKVEEFVGRYISMLYFRKLGYLSATSSDFLPSGVRGTPDITCWNTPLVRKVREFGLVEGGSTLYELSMLRALGRVRGTPARGLDKDESIVVEVESDAPSSGVIQLLGHLLYEKGPYPPSTKEGYAESGVFDGAFLVAPFYDDQRVGVLSFNEKGLFFRDSPSAFSTEKKEGAIREVDEALKYVLLSNLTFDEIQELAGTKQATCFHTLQEAGRLKDEKILEKISSLI